MIDGGAVGIMWVWGGGVRSLLMKVGRRRGFVVRSFYRSSVFFFRGFLLYFLFF